MTGVAAFDARQHDSYDALRLLRLVRARRELRLVWTLALIGLPVWFAAVVGGQAVIPQSSPVWDWLGDHADAGFGLLTLLVLAGLLAQWAVRLAGPTGRLAAVLVPVVGARPEPAEMTDPAGPPAVAGRVSLRKDASDAPLLAGLVPALRRRALVSPFGLLILVVTLLCIVAVATQLVPVWRANHGHGGPRFTVGSQYGITRSEQHYTRYGTRTDYYLDTPLGEALAEDRKPRAGQQWVVLDKGAGEDQAYLVGGHDYLLVGAITALFGAFGVAVLLWLLRGARRERRRRAQAGHVPLAQTLARLDAGGRGLLAVSFAPSSRVRRERRPPVQVWITHEAAAVRRMPGGRRARLSVAVIAVAGVAVAAVLIVRSTSSSPPSSRTVATPYLAVSGWGSSVYVSYDGNDSTVQLLASAANRPHDSFGAPWNVTVTATRYTDPSGGRPYASVRVVPVGSGAAALPAQVVAQDRGLAAYNHTSAVPVAGLPSGWRGVTTLGTATEPGGTDLLAATGGYLVWVSYYGPLPARGQAVELPDGLRAGLVRLAAALADRGVARFARDTGR